MGVPIHRIVCSALNGLPSTDQHAVDHIDTDRANNRPEYLRWFPRLENGLLNETTVRRIEPAFGSIEAFLEDPSKPINKPSFSDVSWLRTLTKEESPRTKSRFEAWSKSRSVPGGGAIVEDALVVLTRTAEADPIKDPAFAMITIRGELFAHRSQHQYFTYQGALKTFCQLTRESLADSIDNHT